MYKTPKQLTYRKRHKMGRSGLAKAGYSQTAPFAMKALSRGQITARQIEAARVAISRFLGRKGRLIIQIFPQTPRTSKPAEVRMGKGKGSVDFYAAIIRPGVTLFELDGVTHDEARDALGRAAAKLNIKTRLSIRQEKV